MNSLQGQGQRAFCIYTSPSLLWLALYQARGTDEQDSIPALEDLWSGGRQCQCRVIRAPERGCPQASHPHPTSTTQPGTETSGPKLITAELQGQQNSPTVHYHHFTEV